jgi:hypothetical protein
VFPRVIATDLDGTLLRSDGTIAPRTRAAIAAVQARGATVVACTARPARWMAELARSGGIHGAAVCANGAVLWDLDAVAVIDSFPVACATARATVARLRPLIPGGAWAVEGVDSFGREPGYHTRWPVPDDAIVDHVETLLAAPPVKLLLRGGGRGGGGPGSEALALVARDAVADLVHLTWSDPSAGLLEMSAHGVTKGSGLAALCAGWGVDAGEVIAFGDMPNDLPMLRWAGHGVAMGNALPAVVQAADEVTLVNDEDGVAVVLERLLAA